MIKYNVDLVVIEGMGRTLHTNLYAKMKCECLKLAVVKNRWLALRLGGDMYAVICKYEKPLSKPTLDEESMNSQNQESFCPMVCTDRDNDHCICKNETQDGKNFIENEIDDRTQKIDEASSIIVINEDTNESIENNN